MPRSLHLLTSFPPRILSITPAQPPLPVTFQTLYSDHNSHLRPLPPSFQLTLSYPSSSHTLIPSGTTMHGSPIFLLPLTPFMPSLPPLRYLNSIVKHHTYTLMPLHPFLACNPDPTLPTSYVLLCNGAWLEKKYTNLWAGLKAVLTAAW